jgi:hypothetical protein
VSRIITFYSYKGGTGRTMALANVAWILASAGNRVLTIDWDLEAPGLHRYFSPFLTDKELTGQESQGVIDMAMDFAVRAATPVRQGEQRSGKWHEDHADFSKWRQKLRWPSGEAVRLGKQGKGEIDFVPAGRQGADYAKRVNRFDWHNFYETLGGGAFFDAAKRKLDAYDYVLIDSRTGVSDTSGICTIQMPDTLVVCFTLNYQSIKGALAVAQSVREQRPEIRIFPVPTRVDGGETDKLNRMKNYAAGVFGSLLDPKLNAPDYWFAMEVPYRTRYAYAETLALFEEQASISASTLPAMVRLSEYLTDGAVKSVKPLPRKERILALAEFEGTAEADLERATPATKLVAREGSIRLFISCSREDRDVARAIADGLRKIDGRIEMFLDSDSVQVGGSFPDAISKALEEADFLLVVDTGATKRTGFTRVGLEVGFFSALLQGETRRHRESERRIICLYAGQPPQLATQFLGIDIGIDDRDLRQGRADYMRKPVERRADPLARFFYEVADRADRLSLPEGSFNLDLIAHRELQISDIIRDVRGELFDSMSMRASLTVEQKRIGFELSPAATGQTFDSIPQDTKVTFYSGAGDLFGVSFKEDTITWEEMSRAARDPSMLRGLALLVTNAVSPVSGFEIGQQTIRAPSNGRVFDALVSRLTKYFDGRKVVEVYLIERLQHELGKGDTAIILGFITVAAKVNSMFERHSPVSAESFIFESNPTRIQDKVRQFMEQLRSIDDESAELGLDDASNIRVYLGDDRSRLKTVSLVQQRATRVRERLLAAADRVLHTAVDSPEFQATKEQWLEAITAFCQVSNQLQSVMVVPAIDNLKKAFLER